MEIKKINEWMNDYEEAIYNKLMLTKKLCKDWRDACNAQRTLFVNSYMKENRVEIPEMQGCYDWPIAPTWKKEEFEIFDKKVTMIYDIITVEGEEYKDHIHSYGSWEARSTRRYNSIKECYNGLRYLLIKHGLLYSEVEWVKSHDVIQIRARAHKEMLNQKKAIEEKVKKICGEQLTNVEEIGGEIFVKGSNGKLAHIWSIYAGGYNIQCLHVRVLVKEVK